MIKTVEDYDNFVITLDEKHQSKTLLLCATTNQAAERLTASTNRDVTTIHSLLGLVVKNNTVTGQTNLARPNNRTFSIIRDSIVFIDEASMISNVYSEGEFFRFGSGLLLNDLMKYINFDNNQFNKKII